MYITPKLFLFLTFTTLLSSCKSQPKKDFEANTAPASALSIGTQADQLSKAIWNIFQDSRGHYWFGSDGEGIYHYDGKTLINYTIKDGLAGNRIRQIQEDKKGHIFISTLEGISKFDGKQFTILDPVKSDSWRLDPNDMWFNMLGKSEDKGPYRYDGQVLHQLTFPKHHLHDEVMKNRVKSILSPYEVYTQYRDRKGAMWFGTSELGACRYDGQSIKWMYEEGLTLTPRGGSFGIRSIYEDNQGQFWFCNTKQRFVFDFDKTAKSDRLQYSKIPGIGSAKDFGGDDYIFYQYIVDDNDGHIWMSTWDQGVFKYDGKDITHYPIKVDNNYFQVGVDNNNIHVVSIYKDKQGTLWLGTAGNGVFKFDGKKFVSFMNG